MGNEVNYPFEGKLIPAQRGNSIADAEDVKVDDTNLSSVTATNSQAVATELERLFGIVSRISAPTDTTQRPLNTFRGAVSFPPDDINDFLNRNSLYVNNVDARVNFQLPLDTQLTGQYPVTIELSHFGGTQRFDTGATPTNTVVILAPTDADTNDPGSLLRRNTATGPILQFAEIHRGDTAVLTKQDANSPWVVVESSADPRSSILPDGVFQFNSRTIGLGSTSGFFTGLSLYTPSQGDAFEVTTAGTLNSRSVAVGDVLVAITDSPNQTLTNNDDWIIIHNAESGELSLSELRFLAQISEADTFSDIRLETISDVSNVAVWVSPYPLDHAPFLTPSTDPDNPQGGETGRYIGGNELDGASFDFRATVSDLGDFAGTTSADSVANAHVYVDIDGTFDVANNIGDIFMVHTDIDGEEISRHSLDTEFRAITLPGSTDTYYVFDDVGAQDNFSSINYHAGQQVNIVLRNTNRQFNFSNAINVLSAIRDGSIDISKLDLNTQALIRADHSLTDDQEAKLDGLQTTGTATTWTAGDLYVKVNDHASNDLANYVNVGQANGIIPDYERARTVTFLVPNFVTVTQLQKVEDTATKLAVTSIGTILGRQAFTATLPAITGANSVLDNAWQVDGTASNLELTGADNSFKVGIGNLGQDVLERIDHTSNNVPEYHLPENLEALNRVTELTQSTTTGWMELATPIRSVLERQFAALWTENRRTFTDNFFDDIADIDVIGFQANNVYWYRYPTDPHNLQFPGAQSYILNAPVRIRNTSGGSEPITSSFRKIIAFDYALQRQLTTDENVDMLRVGNTSTTPLISLAEQEGLYLQVGRADGTQRTRTINEPLVVEDGHLSTRTGESTSHTTDIVIPDNLTGSITVTVDIELDSNGENQGTTTQTITITDVAADQTIGNTTWAFTGFPDITANVVYDHDNTDGGTTRRILRLPWNAAFTTATITYNVSATYPRSETWVTSNTFVRRPINAGSGHDDYGLFDPHLYNTEQVEERNRVFLMFQKYRENDTEADPEMAVKVIVDGQREGRADEDNIIRLHRPASDFMFDDILFGNFIVAVSHIQCYNYEEEFVPSITELNTLYNEADNWVNAYRFGSETIERFNINADIELGDGRVFILTDTTNGNRYSITVDGGSLTTTQL